MNYEVHHGGNSLNNVANLHVIASLRNTEFFEVLLPDARAKIRPGTGHCGRPRRAGACAQRAGPGRRHRFQADRTQEDFRTGLKGGAICRQPGRDGGALSEHPLYEGGCSYAAHVACPRFDRYGRRFLCPGQTTVVTTTQTRPQAMPANEPLDPTASPLIGRNDWVAPARRPHQCRRGSQHEAARDVNPDMAQAPVDAERPASGHVQGRVSASAMTPRATAWTPAATSSRRRPANSVRPQVDRRRRSARAAGVSLRAVAPASLR